MNFWATWCGPCRNEMPEIQKIYEETQQEEDSDLVILGIAAPGFGQEGSQEEIEAFLRKTDTLSGADGYDRRGIYAVWNQRLPDNFYGRQRRKSVRICCRGS